MASRLTRISDVTKKGAIVLGITVVVGIVLKFGVDATIKACCTKPTPSPTPYIRASYGVLNKLTFTNNPTPSKDIKFSVETLDGKIPPTATISALIYPVTKKTATLDYAEKSQKVAQAFEIDAPVPFRDTNVSYVFNDRVNPGKSLFYNFVTENSRLETSDIFSYISLETGSAPSIESTKTSAIGYINRARPNIPSDGQGINTTAGVAGVYSYINPTTREVNEVSLQSQANITKINFARNPLGSYPVISESTTDANISFTYTGLTASQLTGANGLRLLAAKIIFWQLDPIPLGPAVYPIRTAQSAYTELTQGKGYILSQVKPDETYNIRRVYMAYFEPIDQPDYLQPVWVFDGDKLNDTNFKFRAIVPAVIQGYVQE
jgi:hypothetical protein